MRSSAAKRHKLPRETETSIVAVREANGNSLDAGLTNGKNEKRLIRSKLNRPRTIPQFRDLPGRKFNFGQKVFRIRPLARLYRPNI